MHNPASVQGADGKKIKGRMNGGPEGQAGKPPVKGQKAKSAQRSCQGAEGFPART